jgi:hypothetical protein
MPLGWAILSFFGIWFLTLITIGNLETGFFPAIAGAIAVYLFAARKEATLSDQADNPPNQSFRLPMPHAYAIIKDVLKHFRYGKRRWTIDDKRDSYEINAISEWEDRSWKEHRILVPDGSLLRQVKLQIALRRNSQTELTELAMNWTIESPLNRNECNKLQGFTTQAILRALREAETKGTDFTEGQIG